jgi:hypothetical protein
VGHCKPPRPLPGWFAHLPEQTQYNRRLRRLRSQGCSDFAPDAAYGYCPSKSRFVWGLRLVVICDRKGVPVGYDLVGPKTGQERESVFRLASAHPGSRLFANGGFWGAEYERSMELIGVRLITPEKHKLGKRPRSEMPRLASDW